VKKKLEKNLKYFVINKPYGTISQFSKESEKNVLADFFEFPKDVYPIGRLDTDSEGLLIITNDKKLNNLLLHPTNAHKRTYWVQVDGAISKEAIEKLKNPMVITSKDKTYTTLPAEAKLLDFSIKIKDRIPPIRVRKNIPTTWIELVLVEGKNRQVRKMTAAIGFPTLRLIRSFIENLALGQMKPGDVIEISKTELYSNLQIKL
jgi:23S rRNA pseudouridine2457 synthase